MVYYGSIKQRFQWDNDSNLKYSCSYLLYEVQLDVVALDQSPTS